MGKRTQKKENAEIQVEFQDVLTEVKAAKTVTQNKFWIKGLKERKAELNRAQKLVENQVQTINMGDIRNVKSVKKNMTELEKAIIGLSDYTKDVTEICTKLNDYHAQYPLLKDYFTHEAEFDVEKGAITLKAVEMPAKESGSSPERG